MLLHRFLLRGHATMVCAVLFLCRPIYFGDTAVPTATLSGGFRGLHSSRRFSVQLEQPGSHRRGPGRFLPFCFVLPSSLSREEGSGRHFPLSKFCAFVLKHVHAPLGASVVCSSASRYSAFPNSSGCGIAFKVVPHPRGAFNLPNSASVLEALCRGRVIDRGSV